MSGKSIGILSVSVKQEPSIFKEVFRLYGEQGSKWNNAQVPIVGLNMTSYQFQVRCNETFLYVESLLGSFD